MAQIATTWQAEWQPRQSESLAGQTATIIHRDGSRKEIKFGSDVRLRRQGERQMGTPIIRPIVEGHLENGEKLFDPEDQDIQLGDGSLFRISFSHRGFFFAVEPLRAQRP